MQTDETRALVQRFLEARAANDAATIDSLLADDARWLPPPSMNIGPFQGREKEAIVVDLVRANPDCQLGFLTDTRRMNVALTRARRFLLVVGDSATIGAHPYYAAFLAAAESAGAWISAWSDEAPPL